MLTDTKLSTPQWQTRTHTTISGFVRLCQSYANDYTSSGSAENSILIRATPLY